MSPVVASRRRLTPARVASFFTVSLIWLAAFLLAPATAASAQTYVVTTTADSNDGSCTTTVCSLRDAIVAADTTAGSTIDASGVQGVITLGSALPAITVGTTINGPGAGALTISGASTYPVFAILVGTAAQTVSISGLTVAYAAGGIAFGPGAGAGYGSGLFAYPETGLTVDLTGMVFHDTTSTSGGSAVTNEATMVITNSTFYSNQGPSGGAVYNDGALTVTGSSFYSNSGGNGSAVYNTNSNGGTLVIRNSTIANNTVTGTAALYIGSGTVTVTNSTFSDNLATGSNGANIGNAGAMTLYNDVFVEASSAVVGCTPTNAGPAGPTLCPVANTDTPDTDGNLDGLNTSLLMGPLGYHGGSTETLVPEQSPTKSPAICGGVTADDGGILTDQRGFGLDSCGPGAIDSGSVQLQSLVVTNLNDSGTGSLRAAITTANTNGAGDITFQSGVTGTINLASILPSIEGAVNISGPGASQLLINAPQGAAADRIFFVDHPGSLSIANVTLENGNNTNSATDPGLGGAILNANNLSVDSVVFQNNTSTNVGGAIDNPDTTANAVVINNSSFIDNTATGNGGAIETATALTVSNSTFSANTSTTGNGSAIDDGNGQIAIVTYSTFANNTAPAGYAAVSATGASNLTVTNDTFSGNTGGLGAGDLYNGSGTMVVTNTVEAATAQCAGTGCPTSGTAGNVIAPTNLNTGYAGLSNLGAYGGPTQTILPLPGSSAICGGVVADIPNGVTTDQRGFANTAPGAYGCTAGTMDSGAVQTDYTAVAFNAASYTGSKGVAGSTPPMLVDFTENGNAIAVTPLSITTGGAAGAPTAGTTATTTGTAGGFTGASFSGLTFNPATTPETATVAENLTVFGTDVISTGPFNFVIGAGGTTAVVVTDAAPSSPTVLNNVNNVETLGATVTHSGTGVTEGYVTFTVCGGTYPACTAVGTAVGPLAVNGSGTATTPYTIPSGTTAGTYYILAHYTDPGGTYATTDGDGQNITVNNPLAAATAIPTTTLIKNVAATPFTPVTASGGIPPYTFSIVAPPALPTNLSIAAATGQISGTPNVASGSTVYTVKVTDSETTPATSTATFSLQVNAPTITITPTTLTAATVGIAYTPTVTLVGAGGTGPYTFAVTTGALPAGTVLSSAGVLSGTPTAGGSFSFTVTATDANLNTGTQAYTWTVNAPTITVTPAAGTLNATTNIAYTQTFAASGGTPNYTWTETGALPAGITFNAATATLSGTTAAAGSYPITIKATDSSTGSGPYSQSNAYTLVVGAPTITITPATLTAATAGVTFSQQLMASGGATPYTYGVTAGALPAGVTLTSAGLLSGKPTAAGSFTFTVTATDNNTNKGTQAYTLTVNGPTLSLLPAAGTLNATVATAFSQAFTASGGNTPYTYTETGTLPAGLTWDAATATLSGTPTEAGSFAITIKATDSTTGTGSPFSVTNAYTLTVAGPTLSLLPATGGTLNATAETAFSQAFTASGGTAPYTYSETGALPAGITFTAATGTLSGTATASGSFPISIKATDSTTGTGAPFSVTNSYTLVVAAPTITVSPATLTAATDGTAYTATFTAAGGDAPYTFTVTGGALPAGLTLAASGALTGTPTAAGNFTFTVTGKDVNNFTGSKAYSLTVNAPTISELPASGSLTATGEAAYTQTFTASGGTGPYTFVETGTLPTGITWNAGTATLSGTATQGGSFPITIKVIDSSTGTGAPFSVTNSYTLTVNGPTITLTPATLTAGAIATTYTATFGASGATAPYTFSVTTGALPAGLTLSSAGVLSGTPTAAGTFNFTVTAKDTNNFTGSMAYTFTINAPTVSLLPAAGTLNATGEAAFTQAFTASGGTSPYTYTETGALPAGITWNAATGTLSGTPTASGTFPISIKATDSSTGTGAPFSSTNNYALTVAPPAITVAPATLSAGTVATAYSATITATGGVAPYTFSVTAGSLPAGLTLATSGALTGTPTAGGTFTLTVTAKDSDNFTASQAYTLTVNGATVILTPAAGTLTGTAYAAFSQTFTASGGTAPYTYTETGTLPAGLTFNNSTGVLSGTPTVSGSFPITVKATDSSTGSGPYSSTAVAYTISLGTATVVINWANPAAITYGTTLAGVLNATATFSGNPVAGTFTYSSTPGGAVTAATVLGAGSYTLTASFTPTDTAYGTPTPKTVPLMVNQAQPTLAWTPATTIGYGTSLSALLNATSSFGGNPVAGTFAYTATPAGGAASAVTSATVLPDGTYTLAVTFTPTDTTDYKAATATSPLTVTSQSLTVKADNATKVYGTANPTFTGTVTGAVNGDTFTESFSTTATATSNVGTYPIVPSVTGANLSDYTVVTDDGTLTVTQAGTTTALAASGNSINPGTSVTFTATVASATTGTPTGTVTFYDGSTMLGTETLAAGASGDVATFSTSALLSGTHTITAVYSGDVNFTASSTTSSLSISVAPLGLTLSATPSQQTGNPGTTFTYNLALAPAFAGTPYPGTVSFAANGGPTGAVITFSPSTLAANAGAQTVQMTLATSASTADLQPLSTGRKLVPVAFALLLLPLAGTRRMRRNGKRLGRLLAILLLGLVGVAATTALSGCGSSAGGTQQTTQGTQYTVTITATSGSVSQKTTVTLTLL